MNYVPQRRKDDRYQGRVSRFFHRVFFLIGLASAICGFFFFMTVGKMANYVPPPLPEKILLTFTFKSGLEEAVSKPSLSQPLLRPAHTLHEVIEALDTAAGDARVLGFAAKMEDLSLAPAQIQELRDAISRFRKAGKFAYVYGESFGGFSSGMGDYYLASAFEQVWLQPVGAVAIMGVAAEVPFLKGVLDKIGVSAEFAHRGIYKSGPESLTETGMSAPHREMMTGLIGDLAAQIIQGIARDRKIDPAELRKMVDTAPYAEAEALKLNLIDRIGYYDQMLDGAQEQVRVNGEKTDPVDLLGYSFIAGTTSLNKGMAGFIAKFSRKDAPLAMQKDKAKIALIIGSGEIIPFSRKRRGGVSEGGMAADKIVEAFEKARKDEDVAAVVFRVDSPGGAPSAAETIRRAVILTQKAGKPVVVSMGATAASGGYWLAAPADKIIAQPATITGSIGVFGGKIVLQELWQKLGVSWEAVAEGENARMWSMHQKFSPAEKEKFDALLGVIYESFLQRVAEGRRISRAEAEAAAQGRVWTGRQAKELKLVDDLGGLEVAVAEAKKLAQIDPEKDVPLVQFPPRKSTLQMFIALATEGALFSPDIQISLKDVLPVLTSPGTVPEISLR